MYYTFELNHDTYYGSEVVLVMDYVCGDMYQSAII